MGRYKLILLCLLSLSAAAAPTNQVIFNFENSTAEGQRIRQVSLYPLGNRTNGTGSIITVDPVTRATGTNGSVTFSNLYYGAYRGEFFGTGKTTTNFYNFPATNGTINASDWTSVPTNYNGLVGYSQNSADARFVNVTGDTMTGGLTNRSGIYGNGVGLTNLPAANEELLIYNVKSFGAVGDGTNVNRCSISSGSQTLTSSGGFWTSADVGKSILIYGAGASGIALRSIITNVGSATSITISNPASTTVTGSGAAAYGTDNTVAVQAALDFATPIGAQLFFPKGIYVIAGDLRDTGTNSLHHNAQLYLPDVPANPGQVAPTLTLFGPMTINSRGQGVFQNNDINTFGAVIWSFYPRGPDANCGRMLDCKNFTTATSSSPACNGEHHNIPLNNVNVIVRDLMFIGAFDNNISLLDLRAAPNASVYRCFFAAGYPEAGCPEPTGTNGYAVQMPSAFTQNMNVFNENVVIGFYNCVEISSSTYGSINWLTTCVNAMFLDNGPIANRFELVEVYQARNAFRGGQCEVHAHINAALHNNVQGWWSSSQKVVNDPGNAITGYIRAEVNNTYTNSLQPVGATSLEFDVIGNNYSGTYTPSLHRGPLTAQAGGVTGQAQYTSGWGADSGALTMTANNSKAATFGFARYQDTNYNNCALIGFQGFNSDLTILGLGADDGMFSKKGANWIRFWTASSGSATPVNWCTLDGAGRIVPGNSAFSIGADGAGIPTIIGTNWNFQVTNTAPVNTSTVRAWIQVTGQGQTFKLPLYQ